MTAAAETALPTRQLGQSPVPAFEHARAYPKPPSATASWLTA